MAGTKQLGLTFGKGTVEWQHLERECRKYDFLTPTTLCRRYVNQRIALAEAGLEVKDERNIGVLEVAIKDPKLFSLITALSDLPSGERKKKVDSFLKEITT